jgi:hypothetical protein
MSALRRPARGPRIGVALSASTLCAAIVRDGDTRPRAWRASIAPLNGESGGWVALVDALRALAVESGAPQGGRLCIALMPPLAEARGIELPPVGEHEAQQLLARSAGRYFAAARGPQVIGAVRVPLKSGSPTQGVVAAAASTRLLQAIHEAARNAGWTIDTVVPAEAAWAAAGAAWSRRKSGASLLLVAHGDRTDLVRVEGEAFAGLRRFRAGGADAALIAEAATDAAARVSVVGDPDARRDLSQALANRGVSIDTPATAVPEVTEEPDFLAAVFATGNSAPRLVTDVERAERAISIRQFTTRLAVAAAVLLVIAGAIEFWGVNRELQLVQAQREALRPQLATTLVGRTTVETAYQQLAVLADAERTAPEWSSVLSGITAQLPLEAYLTGFRGHGDSVAVDGLAARAARVFDALDRVRALSNVRATAPVRLETPIDGPPLERFTISALVGPPAAPARGATAGRGGARR